MKLSCCRLSKLSLAFYFTISILDLTCEALFCKSFRKLSKLHGYLLNRFNISLWISRKSLFVKSCSFCENKLVRKYRTSAFTYLFICLFIYLFLQYITKTIRAAWASNLFRRWSPSRSWFPSILCCTRSHIGWHHLHTCHWYKDLNCTRQYWRHSEDLKIRLGIYSDKVPGETRSEGNASS